MRLRAYAKINLALDVLRKREDGYHDVRMIMQTIRMYDTLDIKKSREPGVRLTANLPYIPTDGRNLVCKAASLLMEEYRISEGADVTLNKFIPVAAGMAGGSADAAAALIGMNRLFGLQLSQKELMELGVRIGADVPYCILGGTALAEGIGEQLSVLWPLPRCHILIGKPGVNVSTRMAYENLKLDQIQKRPDIDGMIADLKNGSLLSMTEKMENVFEPGIAAKYPVIAEIRELMETFGARKAMMSGSGPTVFGIFDEKEKLDRAAAALRESGLAKTVFATEPCSPDGF